MNWRKWLYCKLLRDHRNISLIPVANGWSYQCLTCGKGWFEDRRNPNGPPRPLP